MLAHVAEILMLRRQLFPAQIADELVVDLGVGFHLDGGADELALSAHREFAVRMGQFYVTLLRVEVLEDQIAVALEFLALVILRKDRNVAVFYCPSVRPSVGRYGQRSWDHLSCYCSSVLMGPWYSQKTDLSNEPTYLQFDAAILENGMKMSYLY